MNMQALLGPDTYKQLIRDADTEQWEAENGICCDEDVCAEDREPPTSVGIFDPIPMPRDPYGCANPVSQEDSGE